MKHLQMNEVSQLIERRKQRFVDSGTIKSVINIKSRYIKEEYCLEFTRNHRRDSGHFYLIKADKKVELHDLVVHHLLENIKRGNYEILWAVSSFEDGSFLKVDPSFFQSTHKKTKGESER
jgi:hypothetical protein